MILFLCLAVLVFQSCQNDKSTVMTTVKEQHHGHLGDSLIIAPIYPDTVYFAVEAKIKKQTMVRGDIEGFQNQTIENHELYFQRYVEKEGPFRVIHCVGSALETTYEFGKEQYKLNRFNDTIKFDELGIFGGPPGDPVDLIPLYPGHPVSPGEYWKPEAKVKIPMGAGLAQFSFIIDSLYKDQNNSVLGRMQIKVEADLEPIPSFHGGKVTVSGGGWIIWDCTINQRRETHLKATYRAVKGEIEVEQLISVDDDLQVNKGRKQF
jgi:hypothetical protein